MTHEITDYTDYRQLLRDYYEHSKKRNPGFSFQLFSQKAGISSRGFLYNVVTGKRRLAPSHIDGVAKAMKMSKLQQEYFEYLVAYNNARSINEKKRNFERMHSIKISGKSSMLPYLVRKDQYQYYSHWYHAVVRSIIGLTEFSDDYEQLAQQVAPPITTTQARKSVALLEKIGFIKKNKNGVFSLTRKTITSAPEVQSLAIHNFHQQTQDIACKAFDTLPCAQRNFTGVTLGISTSVYQQVCKELEQFRNHLLELAGNDNNSDEEQGVYHLNLQLFPVSNKISPRSKS